MSNWIELNEYLCGNYERLGKLMEIFLFACDKKFKINNKSKGNEKINLIFNIFNWIPIVMKSKTIK